MNIASTRSGIHYDRTKAKKAYQKAQKSRNEAQETFQQTRQDDLAKADRYALYGGIGMGAVAAAGVAVAGMVMNSSFDAEAIIGLGMIGGAVGIGAGAGVQAYFQSQGRKQRSETVLPALQTRNEEFIVARENFRNSLLQEMNDDGVVNATQPKWESLKRDEAKNSILANSARDDLGSHLSKLEGLADGRKADGWMGKMANLEDNPVAFAEQKEAVAKHPTLQKMMECNNG